MEPNKEQRLTVRSTADTSSDCKTRSWSYRWQFIELMRWLSIPENIILAAGHSTNSHTLVLCRGVKSKKWMRAIIRHQHLRATSQTRSLARRHPLCLLFEFGWGHAVSRARRSMGFAKGHQVMNEQTPVRLSVRAPVTSHNNSFWISRKSVLFPTWKLLSDVKVLSGRKEDCCASVFLKAPPQSCCFAWEAEVNTTLEEDPSQNSLFAALQSEGIGRRVLTHRYAWRRERTDIRWIKVTMYNSSVGSERLERTPGKNIEQSSSQKGV